MEKVCPYNEKIITNPSHETEKKANVQIVAIEKSSFNAESGSTCPMQNVHNLQILEIFQKSLLRLMHSYEEQVHKKIISSQSWN